MLKKFLTLGGVAVLLVGIGACGGGSGDSSSPTPPGATGAGGAGGGTATGGATPGTISPANLPTLPRVANPQGAIRALTLGTCNTGSGSQKVTGQVKSPARSKVDFLVSVAWTTDRGDVLGRGFAVIRNVPPGASRSFEITAKVADGATRCVPNVQYGNVR